MPAPGGAAPALRGDQLGERDAVAVAHVHRGELELGAAENSVAMHYWPDNRHLGAYVGGDIIMQIGTAKYGVRDESGCISDDKLREVAAHEAVRAFVEKRPARFSGQ